jgi:uncharacterized protein (UPF0212 family)
MDVRNCRKCGKVFNYVMGPIMCPQCRDKLEEKFQEVKEYVFNHRGCGIQEVSEACDVTPQQIKQWLREERLQFSEDSAVWLNCEGCGVSIRCGRFCDKCKNSMANNLKTAYRKEPAPEPPKKKDFKDNARMRYLDR